MVLSIILISKLQNNVEQQIFGSLHAEKFCKNHRICNNFRHENFLGLHNPKIFETFMHANCLRSKIMEISCCEIFLFCSKQQYHKVTRHSWSVEKLVFCWNANTSLLIIADWYLQICQIWIRIRIRTGLEYDSDYNQAKHTRGS